MTSKRIKMEDFRGIHTGRRPKATAAPSERHLFLEVLAVTASSLAASTFCLLSFCIDLYNLFFKHLLTTFVKRNGCAFSLRRSHYDEVENIHP